MPAPRLGEAVYSGTDAPSPVRAHPGPSLGRLPASIGQADGHLGIGIASPIAMRPGSAGPAIWALPYGGGWRSRQCWFNLA